MSLFISPFIRALDGNGAPLPGAKLYFYQTETLTPADVYTTSERTTPHDNPVVADAGGLFPLVYLNPSVTYRAILKTAGGSTVQDADPYNFDGSNAIVGLFDDAGSLTLPEELLEVDTIGYSTPGKGAARYVYDEDLDASYVADNPRSSFITENDRVYKLSETRLTPYMFGAAGVTLGETDVTMTDDGPAFQAFLDYAFPVENRGYVYDPSGEFATGQKLYACYPATQTGLPTTDHAYRRFHGICKIRVLPLNRQSGGVAMDYVLTIGGLHTTFDGLYISGFDSDGNCPAYASKRFGSGIRLFYASFCAFGKIVVEGAKRDSVYFDPTEASTTFRTGTDFEVTYPYSNNIGVRIENLYGRKTGSYDGGFYTTNWSAMAHGGVLAGAFDPTPASYTNSTSQRTKLTFPSTAEFRQYDYGKLRLQLLPATYGTIAADATASTLTWSAGDPVAAGLVVGDVIIPQSGLNAGKRLEILSFSGGSNRVIKVSGRLEAEAGNPSVVTEAATAITGLYTRWAPYIVMEVLNATEVLVWPWVENRLGSSNTWTSIHGHVANVTGSNTANVTIGMLCGINAAGILNAQSLYGPKVSSILAEACEIGATIGYSYSSVHLGTVIEHIHAEICEFNVIQATSSNTCHVIVKGGSNYYKGRTWCMISKAASGDALMPTRPLNFFTLDLGGEMIINRQDPSFSGSSATSFTITNRREERQVEKVMNGPITCTLDFDFDVARLSGNHHWAEIHWIGPTGAAPTSTLTFALSAELTLRGWTITGTNPISGPAKPCRVRIHFHNDTKTVLLTRYDAV